MIGFLVGVSLAMAFVTIAIAATFHERLTNVETIQEHRLTRITALEPAANDEEFGEFDPEEFPLL